ncbi:hypothetical protein RV15_GL001720 [Enterococcus silesiacus]|uniref:Glycoside hydrolase family 20 catalytic domain-containing protein n=1 Tax=Enterococcus silesiacus TaxID=332949 RepID=A0AA91GIZ3_9ENTE|nr:hypothetical protein RV15_GL001720 [Enterococcus silesiacus]
MTNLFDLQNIYFYMDQSFGAERERIAYLYVRLLNKRINFVKIIERADVIVSCSSELKNTFVLEVAESIVIQAGSRLTAFRGVMYLAKLLKTGAEIPTGKFSEAVKERIVMLDIGRKYFSPVGLHRILEEMALYGCNFLQLHFSENSGFRIESINYPQLVSDEFLSIDEVKELIRYAAYLSIEIIPDIDTPGHMEHLLKTYPDWQLSIQEEASDARKVPAALDITNQQAVSFVLSLYQEYLQLFSDSRYFHIGGDEFVEFDQMEQYPALKDEGVNTFENYVNTIANFVGNHGFIPRVWNDAFFRNGQSSRLTKNVEITYWTKWQKEMAPVQTFLDEGYTVINFNDNYLYYVLGENAGDTYPTAEKIKEHWQPDLFASQQLISPKARQRVKGAALAVWCDKPKVKEEDEIITDLIKLLEGFSCHFYKIN